MSACSSQQAVGWFLVEERQPRERKALVQSPGLTSWYGSSVCCDWGAARPWLEPGLD